MLFQGFDIISLLYNIPAVLICITVHEFSHGYMAYRLGDFTAKSQGRLSLNPLRHIDPLGFLCLILFRFGWAKPVPVSYAYLRNPKRDMPLIAAAGPISNVLLAFFLIVIFTLIIAFGTMTAFLQIICQFLYITAFISVGLAVFNLIPIHPLDGSRIFMPLLPKSAQAFFINNGQTIQIILVVLLFLGYLRTPISFLISVVMKLLLGVIILLFRVFGMDVSPLYSLFGV